MSVRMTASSSWLALSPPFFKASGKRRPIATPATGRLRGTPASSMASVPEQTDAMLELPHDSAISQGKNKELRFRSKVA